MKDGDEMTRGGRIQRDGRGQNTGGRAGRMKDKEM